MNRLEHSRFSTPGPWHTHTVRPTMTEPSHRVLDAKQARLKLRAEMLAEIAAETD